jgi:hypothetical protein
LSPGRRTNRENFRSCQRTIMVLLFSFLESMKNMEPYLPNFQSSAGGSQACAADLVQTFVWPSWERASSSNFRGILLPAPLNAAKGG